MTFHIYVVRFFHVAIGIGDWNDHIGSQFREFTRREAARRRGAQWRMEKVEREARVSEVKEEAPETEKIELTLEDKSWLGEPHHVSDLELEDDGFLLSSLGCRILTVDGDDDEKEADKSRKPKKTMKRAKYKGKHSTTRPRPAPSKSSQCCSSTDPRSCPSSSRVAKCHFFTQIISVQPNLPQEKARKSRQVFYI